MNKIYDTLLEYYKPLKPQILCIAGMSGTGKTLSANYLNTQYGIPVIESYTDRPKRTENETGHTFISKEEYDSFRLEDMIAHTKFGNHRYCCLKKDIKDYNLYVIDEDGIRYLKDNFNNDYDITTLWIDSPINQRFHRLDEEYGLFIAEQRMQRDDNRKLIPIEQYDYVVDNSEDLGYLFSQLEDVFKLWLGDDITNMVDSWR
jgi:guanylate kinase